MAKFKIPRFSSEAEEARWWMENRDKVTAMLGKAEKGGRHKAGSISRLQAEGESKPAGPVPTTTIRLDPDDIALARRQAAELGLRYQTYLKMIIHKALRRAEKKRRSA